MMTETDSSARESESIECRNMIASSVYLYLYWTSTPVDTIIASWISNSGPKKSQNEKHISYYTINFICHWKLIQNLAQNEKWLKIVLTKFIFAACSLQHGAGHGWPTGRSPQRLASRMDKQMMASAVASVQNNSKQLIFDLGISANCFLVVACLKPKTRLRFCCDWASFLYSALRNMLAGQFWGARTDCFLEKQSNVQWNLFWRLAHHEKHSFCFTETKCELLKKNGIQKIHRSTISKIIIKFRL